MPTPTALLPPAEPPLCRSGSCLRPLPRSLLLLLPPDARWWGMPSPASPWLLSTLPSLSEQLSRAGGPLPECVLLLLLLPARRRGRAALAAAARLLPAPRMLSRPALLPSLQRTGQLAIDCRQSTIRPVAAGTAQTTTLHASCHGNQHVLVCCRLTYATAAGAKHAAPHLKSSSSGGRSPSESAAGAPPRWPLWTSTGAAPAGKLPAACSSSGMSDGAALPMAAWEVPAARPGSWPKMALRRWRPRGGGA